MEADDNLVLIEQWKLKRLIKKLDAAQGYLPLINV